jgi:hypothetical protein
MPAPLVFVAADDAPDISATELHHRLDDQFDLTHSEELRESGRRFELGETGITVSFVLDENGSPMAAVAELADNPLIEHVTRLCKTFKALGWSF